MAITINTNLSSMVVQANLTKATKSLNSAIERMTTGYKINHASDNAAGYSIAKNWETKLSSLDIAADNAATGADLLSTLEDNYALVQAHVQRVRDLTEQAANGTYGEDSKKAIEAEIKSRLEEVDRIAANCEFNGIDLMKSGSAAATDGISLQVGTDGVASKSQIHLDSSLFSDGSVSGLFGGADIAELAAACSGRDAATTPQSKLSDIDNVLKSLSEKATKLGAAQNRIDSAIESIEVQSQNITSSLSTLRDADVAEESSAYIKAQILQQASATLLATANQSPSIALNLL